MALYSVWDWDKNVYAIYQDGTPVSVGDDPKPPKPTNVGAIGADPDTQIKTLPSGAKFMGYDQMARGEIRRVGGLPLGLDEPADSNFVKYAIGAAIGGGLVWWWLSEQKKSR